MIGLCVDTSLLSGKENESSLSDMNEEPVMKSRRRIKLWLSLVLVMVIGGGPALFGQQKQADETRKLGQTGFKFLTISVDARAAAMGDAMTSQNVSSTAMFYNPASMARMTGTLDVGVNLTQWIADVDYSAVSFAYQSPIGVFGVSGVMVKYPDFLETIRADNAAGYQDLGTIQPSANAFGIGYARSLTDRFSIGGVVKYATQNLGNAAVRLDENDEPVRKKYEKSVVVYDFGVIYSTGFKSLQLAMSARNFSRELTYAQENFELPLSFRIGLSMDLMDLTSMNPDRHSLLLSVDTERPRDYWEQLKIGAEYTFMNLFAVRAGYITPHDEQGLNVGFGLKNLAGLDLDYAYTQFGVFGGVNRFSVRYEF